MRMTVMAVIAGLAVAPASAQEPPESCRRAELALTAALLRENERVVALNDLMVAAGRIRWFGDTEGRRLQLGVHDEVEVARRSIDSLRRALEDYQHFLRVCARG